ncbi:MULTISPECIES: EH signature domain-containing protein [unclassified Thalassolituus]|uniref:EH signature domain-containing protein n=1 Tax=unclassified Thalassolituus TaxID=2624967 RepID=UPI0025F83327|nr:MULTISPECIES: EH signature domain-containing protein [unclassified Thalassolituus]
MQKGAGKGDNFEAVVEALRYAISYNDGTRIKQIISSRTGARAMTYLWLEDSRVRKSLNPRSLALLVECQQPRLSQIPLINLVDLYFRYFDQLGHQLINRDADMQAVLADVITAQLRLLPEQKVNNGLSVLHNLKNNADNLMMKESPAYVVRQAKKKHLELDEYFKQVGLSGFDQGRFGDICRAFYYLDTLKEIPLGESHPVFAELQKPEVNTAMYEGTLRIGHRAIEILIDRSPADPGDTWRNFILNIAGDPRIASNASNFRQWWQPIGEGRIEKVRGWLSREDLKLFLKAVEQYGEDSDDENLQRMFPARKKFLEGLFDQDLIKSTRLMLGAKAKQGVRRVLRGEMKSSYIDLGGGMSDKAVIYLNCGKFHVIQGSHSFKIWLYLDVPGRQIADYGVTYLDHNDLTKRIPNEYRKEHPGLPLADITHRPGTWCNQVIQFLANNDIELDIEQLMTKTDYKVYMQKFGMPVRRKKR